MIVVRVELWSAITGRRTELARMRIANDGVMTAADRGLGTYVGHTWRGRSSSDLDREVVSRTGRVERYPREAKHVWNLVALMLGAMGYGGRPKDARDTVSNPPPHRQGELL